MLGVNFLKKRKLSDGHLLSGIRGTLGRQFQEINSLEKERTKKLLIKTMETAKPFFWKLAILSIYVYR